MRQKRYPLLLDSSYPPEQRVIEAISLVPKGDQTAFMRALILLGHQDLELSKGLVAKPAPILNERPDNGD
jgi:hypothetical protein